MKKRNVVKPNTDEKKPELEAVDTAAEAVSAPIEATVNPAAHAKSDAPSEAQSAHDTASDAGERRFCMNCGTALRVGDNFCLECGTAIDTFVGEEKFCMNCGSALGEGHLFCLECGTPVGFTAREEGEEEVAATEEAPAYDGPILKVEHLKKYFPIKTNFFGKPIKFLRAVDDINFTLDKGKTIGVVGESGCGKTTLGRTILKLHESSGGKIFFEGKDITDLKKSKMQKYRTDIQLIFQDPYSSLPPRMTVGSIIAEPVRVHKIVPKNKVHSYVLDIMKKCGLKPQHYDRYPHEFSGGQRQRICIARALAVKPKLVICDEPVSALDVSIQAQIINLLKELQLTDELTYVFISHDLSVVKYITDKILVMYLGNAMEMSETDELFDNPLHPYTQALFSAVPAPDPTAKMNRIVLEGDIPSPANPPSGCKFHTRCSKCMKVCKFKEPEYVEAKEGHFVACHLYNEEIMSHLDEYDEEYDRIEAEKQRALEEAQAKKKKKAPSVAAPDEDKENIEVAENAVAGDNAETTETPVSEEHTVNEVGEAEKSTVDQTANDKAEVSEAAPQSAEDEKAAEESKPESSDDDKDDKTDGDNKPDGGTPADGEPTEDQAAKPKKPASKASRAPRSGSAKGKVNKSKFVDDGRTVFDMSGFGRGDKKAAIELTGKERRAMIRAAFAKFLPALLGAIGCFSLAALLIYFWLH